MKFLFLPDYHKKSRKRVRSKQAKYRNPQGELIAPSTSFYCFRYLGIIM